MTSLTITKSGSQRAAASRVHLQEEPIHELDGEELKVGALAHRSSSRMAAQELQAWLWEVRVCFSHRIVKLPGMQGCGKRGR